MRRDLAIPASLAGRRVVVLGMGRSGQAAARLALAEGAEVIATDLRRDAPVPAGCTAVLGEHRREDFVGADLVVVSPGVPAAQADVQAAVAAGVPVVGELGLAAGRLQDRGVPLLAVTGTNGKSSTTFFLGQILEAAGRKVFVGGNLGRPLALALLDADEGGGGGRGGEIDICAVEVSSYQLELPGPLHPKAGVVLNLTPDHLGRHGTLERYAAAKSALFAAMDDSDYAAIPAGDPLLVAACADTAARRVWLGAHPGVTVEGDAIVLRGTSDDGEVPLAGFALPGAHNRANVGAAVLLAVCGGVPRAAIALSGLRPLPHRLETVHEADGVRWVNDSKATNVDAALVGIDGIGHPSIVLLGGQGKDGAEYGLLRPALAANAHAVVCFGASGPTIAEALADLPVALVTTMSDAVAAARMLARPGDTVLLSPACASFDEFTDFEERGRVFASLARGEPGHAAGRRPQETRP